MQDSHIKKGKNNHLIWSAALEYSKLLSLLEEYELDEQIKKVKALYTLGSLTEKELIDLSNEYYERFHFCFADPDITLKAIDGNWLEVKEGIILKKEDAIEILNDMPVQEMVQSTSENFFSSKARLALMQEGKLFTNAFLKPEERIFSILEKTDTVEEFLERFELDDIEEREPR